ncbi:MAG TPA: transcription antitermination factor NusB [Streptosporangiaceae bacterium]|nr:transcription antitermination factor NusB [Streptosporangiaceae bacterium]
MAERARPSRPRPRRRRADPARRAAYDVLRAVADRDAYANLLLPALLTERGLTGRDAAFATELTYGTLRGRGTYDAIVAACSDRDQLDPTVRDVLRLGAHQLLATRVGPHAAVATSVDLAKDVCGPRPSGFVNAVLRRVATRDLDGWTEIVAPSRDRDPYGYLAVRHSYPRWIIEAFADALGQASAAELEAALAAGNLRPDVVLAVTPGRPASQDPASQDPASQDPASQDPASQDPGAPGTTPTRWSPYGLRLAAGDPAPYVASGQVVVQDEASQLAALALTRVSLSPTGNASDPVPDRLWLDLCAGPGGKARLLAGLAAERGARLVASDVRPHRAGRVLDALRRADLDGAEFDRAVIAADGRQVPWRPGTFDRVLADVPCSNLGSLRRRPEARWRKTPDGVPELAVVQRELLNAAIESVRPGGVVAYVTCSPHLAETRDVVTAVAGLRGDVTILDAPSVLADVPGLCASDPRFAQFWPHRHGTDAIFLALLKRD